MFRKTSPPSIIVSSKNSNQNVLDTFHRTYWHLKIQNYWLTAVIRASMPNIFPYLHHNLFLMSGLTSLGIVTKGLGSSLVRGVESYQVMCGTWVRPPVKSLQCLFTLTAAKKCDIVKLVFWCLPHCHLSLKCVPLWLRNWRRHQPPLNFTL